MSYLNIDDGMGDHPKIDRLTDAAFRLHLTAMLYASQKGTDGRILRTRSRLLTATGNDVAVTELIEAGIWHDVGQGCGTATCLAGDDSGYVIHDYLQWNHSAHWWEQRSIEQAAHGSKGMHRRWHERRGIKHPDCKHCNASA